MALKQPSQVIVAALLTTQIFAIGSNDQVNQHINYGTFQNPSNYVRPRFRYWVPDASANLSQIGDDIKMAGAVGAGGVELLGYYAYGDSSYFRDVIPTDWTVYGWGTPAWKGVLDASLTSARDNGMILDFAVGPNQGAGVPAVSDSDGLLWELAPFNVTIPIGESFAGVLPGWGVGPLVSASTGLVISSVSTSSSEPSLPGDTVFPRIQNTLAIASLVDVTSKVDAQGYVNLTLPSNVTGLEYTVFAYYLRHTEYYEQTGPEEVIPGAPQSSVTSFVQNGSWVVDHFSALGAQTVIDFWNNYLLTDGTLDLIREAGNYGWEDSQEFGMGVSIWWTPGFENRFLASRGYSINKWLPVIAHLDGGQNAYGTWFVTDEEDQGVSRIADYRETLTKLNQIYLSTLSNWTQKELGLQFSAQVAYNLPMDMLANIPYVNAPECETLGFGHNIDVYRQFSGPANLAGKRVISSECGANFYDAYQETIPNLLWDVKRSVVGGVNQFVFHGMPYTGYYPNTTWPVFTTFDYLFSEMHGPSQPAWDFYSDFMNWTARTQYIAQTGVPKVDVAFWLKRTSYASLYTSYEPTDLEDAGYSYEYLSPDNLALNTAYVSDGILAPTRQAFKVLIVRANDSLAGPGVTSLARYAQAGLPIVFAGGVPTDYLYHNPAAAKTVNNTITQITAMKNVHVVSADNLAETLESLRIRPRTRVDANSTWYTYWREDSNASMDYVFIYNDATGLNFTQGYSEGSVTFETKGIPYNYDAWTGTQTPILVYKQTKTTTTIKFQLAANQMTIVAFSHSAAKPYPYLASAPEGTLSLVPSSDGKQIIIKTAYTSSSSTPLTLSNGTNIAIPRPTTKSFTLNTWTLTLESWTPTINISSFETLRTNTTYQLSSLLPWSQIANANLQGVSGRGYYNSSFTWSPHYGASMGAYLDFGAIVHTIRVSVNGHVIPPLDVTWARADIGMYLVAGTNVVEAVVASPLGNAMRPVWYELMSTGSGPSSPPPAVAEYGLLGPVSVVPYLRHLV